MLQGSMDKTKSEHWNLERGNRDDEGEGAHSTEVHASHPVPEAAGLTFFLGHGVRFINGILLSKWTAENKKMSIKPI